MTHVVYIASRRPEAFQELLALDEAGEINLCRATNWRRVARLFTRRDKSKLAVFSESMGIYSAMAIFLALLCRGASCVRVKGYVYDELRESYVGRNGRAKLELNRLLTKVSLHRVTLLVPISQQIARHLAEHEHENVSKSQLTIAPGKAWREYLPLKAEGSSENRVVVTITNFQFLEKVRRLPIVLETLSVTTRSLGLEWLIVGDGPLRSNIEKQSKHLDGVRFVGHLSDLPALLSDAIAHVYVSDQDTVGAVLLESFLVGVPCLVNDDFPVDDIREHMLPEQLFDVTSVKGSEQLRRLVEDELLRNRVRKSQEDLLDSMFSPAKVTTQLRSIILCEAV